MVNKNRLAAVIFRRIEAAKKRGDIARKKKLHDILGLLRRGETTPGMALIEIRVRPPARNKPARIRLPGKLKFTPRPKSELRGGL